MSLCAYCHDISLHRMRGPNQDRMQPHQPTYWALKTSAANGCQLCAFFWDSLAYDFEDGYEQEARAAMAATSERYPGREISLAAWGGAWAGLDRINIACIGFERCGRPICGAW